MAINRALMNRQMYNMGGPSLQAGAPDITLTGDMRPTYSAMRKQRMAYGGIAGADGRKRYGIGSWFQENIMDPIKDNPVTSAVIGGGLVNQFGIPFTDDYGKNFLGDLIGGVVPGDSYFNTVLGDNVPFKTDIANIDDLNKYLTTGGYFGESGGNVLDEFGTAGKTGMESGKSISDILKSQGLSGVTGAISDSLGIQDYISQLPASVQQAIQQGTGLGDQGNNPNLNSPGAQDQLALEQYKRRNLNMDLAKALAAGTAAGAYVESQPKDTLAADNTGINFQTAQQVLDDPNQRFKPPVEATQLAAEGGRIGYGNGTPDPIMPENFLNDIDKIVEEYMKSEEGRQELMDKANEGMSMPEIIDQMKQELMMNQASSQGNMQMQQPQMAAMGGRIGYSEGSKNYNEDPEYRGWKTMYEKNKSIGEMHDNHSEYLNFYNSQGKAQGKAEGGLMDLGGNEMDLRAEGGFVPIGGREKADDVPARLSKNEFVFTADAVRNAGGGDIDQGAQVMEKLMRNLESGGQVSEESQGLDGAREMFETSQRLEKRII